MLDLSNVWGEPKYLKDCPVYPVRMKDIEKFYDAVTCLLIPKNSMTDIEIIKMSYLSFLINISKSEETVHLFEKLLVLLKIVFRTDEVDVLVNDNHKYIIRINGTIDIREYDFDKLRDIIAEQNLVETKDESTGSDFDKAKTKAKQDLALINKKVADTEQQIFAYRVEQKESYEVIQELTIYQFRKEIERINLSKTAEVLQNAQYNGMVSFKEGTQIPHWLDQIPDKKPDEDLVLTKAQLDHIANKNGLASL